MQGTGDDTGTETGNTDDTSTIESSSLRIEGREGINNSWRGFHIKTFSASKKLKWKNKK